MPSNRTVRVRRWLRVALVALVLALGMNEAAIWGQSRRLAGTLPLQEFAGLNTVWAHYDRLRGRSYLGLGARGLGQALQRHSLVLAERVTANYRTPNPSVREAQWKAAASALQRALTVAPDDPQLRGTLRYAQGHLHRIDGEADKSRRQTASAQRHFADAVTSFREAAALRSSWPDPYLGLARTFIYGLEDIDRGADAMTQAQKLGYTLGARETAQLADGYRTRGDALDRAAGELAGMPQERESLTRARDAYSKALELYTTIANFSDVPSNIRTTQRRLEAVERKLAILDGRPAPDDGESGGILGPLRSLGRILSGI